MHKQGMFMSLPPRDLGLVLGPVFSVLRVPDIAPVSGLGVFRPSTQHPDPIAICRRRKPQPLAPRSLCGLLPPFDAIRGRPHIIQSCVVRDVVPTAHDIQPVTEDSGLKIGTRRPGSLLVDAGPFFSVLRGPHIALQARIRSKVVVFCSSQQPHLVFEDHQPRGNSWRPSRMRRDFLPLHSVSR